MCCVVKQGKSSERRKYIYINKSEVKEEIEIKVMLKKNAFLRAKKKKKK